MPTTTKKFLTYNVLADVYANPGYYPANAPLDGNQRRLTVIREILTPYVNSGVSVVGLQEVSIDTPWASDPSITIQGQYKYYKAFMEAHGYAAYHASHDKTYWSKYYNYTDPTVYNAYVDTGNALFIKISDFSNINFQNIRLTTGDHMILATAFDNEAQKTVRMACIHYDSDVGGNTNKEFKEALGYMKSEPGVVNVMFGDHNTGFYNSPMFQDYARSGFLSTLYYLRDVTGRTDIAMRSRPESTGWYNNQDGRNPMDHVLFEAAKVDVSLQLATDDDRWGYPDVTLNGLVTKRAWEDLPESAPNDLNEDARVNFWMGPTGGGSDHFAVIASLIY